MISLNTVYQFVSNNERIRIIYLDYDKNLCVYVFIEKTLSMPIVDTALQIEKEYDSNHLVEVIDPYFSMKADSDLSEKEISKRDEAWQIIEKYWETRKNDIINKTTRMSLFQKIADIEDIPLMTVRRIFSRFWQRGMTRNALLPDYAKSGGKGQEKKMKEKNGRRRIYSDNDTEGIIITDAIKKQFEVATQNYWRTSQKKSLRQVYRLMLADFYSITVQDNSEIEKIIWEYDSIPTFNQYYYWFKKNENITLDIKMRDGEKEFELKHRPL